MIVSRRDALSSLAVVTGVGIAGCLSEENGGEPKRVLYVMINNSLRREQQLEVQVERNGEGVVDSRYELPPAGTSSTDIPGTTPESQYMIEPVWEDTPAEFRLRVRYPDSDEWTETTASESVYDRVGAWISTWFAPTIGIQGYPEAEALERFGGGDRAGDRVTAAEVEAWTESFLESQADRDYRVDR